VLFHFFLTFLLGYNRNNIFLRVHQAFALFPVVSLADIRLPFTGFDMKAMASDVEPFLFRAGDEKSIAIHGLFERE